MARQNKTNLNMQEVFQNTLEDSIAVKKTLLESDRYRTIVLQCVDHIVSSLSNGGRVLFCGNGGSAADAQHLAAELSGRFYIDRPPLDAEALHVNTSYLTAVANDYSYDDIFARAVEAKGRAGDVFIAFSTSGNSTNILRALDTARAKEMVCIGFTGQSGGLMRDSCDILLNVPSDITPRIQEAHITLGHIICELVEKQLFE